MKLKVSFRFKWIVIGSVILTLIASTIAFRYMQNLKAIGPISIKVILVNPYENAYKDISVFGVSPIGKIQKFKYYGNSTWIFDKRSIFKDLFIDVADSLYGKINYLVIENDGNTYYCSKNDLIRLNGKINFNSVINHENLLKPFINALFSWMEFKIGVLLLVLFVYMILTLVVFKHVSTKVYVSKLKYFGRSIMIGILLFHLLLSFFIFLLIKTS